MRVAVLGRNRSLGPRPDCAALLCISASIATIFARQPALNFNPTRELHPLSIIVDLPAGLLVRADSPLRSLDGLLPVWWTPG